MRKKANLNCINGVKNNKNMAFLWLTTANLLSKILGYVRDVLIVAIFGGNILSDVYFASFRIINFFRRTIGEGGLNAVFIPVLSQKNKIGAKESKQFISEFWTVLLIISFIISVCGIVFSEQITGIMCLGFKTQTEYFSLAVLITAILFPHFLFINISAFLTSLLNSVEKFFLPAVSQSFFSVTIIISLILFYFGYMGNISANKALLVTVFIASASGLLQIFFILPSVKQNNFSLKLSSLRNSYKLIPLITSAIPTTLVLAQDQIIILISTIFASFLQSGSVTAVYNASRLVQFPVSLFATAAATVSLPILSKISYAADKNEFNKQLYAPFITSLIILFPSAMGLTVLSEPLCTALFEHGKFIHSQTEITVNALLYLSSAVPAFGIIRTYITAFYSIKCDKTPLLIVMGQIILNTAISFPLMKMFQVKGLMLAVSISSWFAALILMIVMYKKTGFSPVGQSLFKILIATLVSFLFAFIPCKTIANAYFVILISLPLCIVSYFFMLKLLDVKERFLIFGGKL